MRSFANSTLRSHWGERRCGTCAAWLASAGMDQAAAPAAGASGLSAGLVVPHVSSDDCALSRLSRASERTAGLTTPDWWLQRIRHTGQASERHSEFALRILFV
jgi:tRNA 5-methylaminomethyl-2-thiouridine biosynthesis bifunctional protein